MTTTATSTGPLSAGSQTLQAPSLTRLERVARALAGIVTVLALLRTTVYGLGSCQGLACPVDGASTPPMLLDPRSWILPFTAPDQLYRLLGQGWVVLSTALGVTALVYAVRGSRWSILLAWIPTLSTILLGSIQLSSVLYLTGVCVVLALRDWRGALVAAALAVNALLATWPWGTVTVFGGTSAYRPSLPTAVAMAGLVLTVGGLAVLFGAWWRSRSALSKAQAAEVAALRAQHEAEKSDAQTRERARVARDLHDVVAHHISLVAVRAESAPYSQPGLDDGARTVLAEIADDARSALAELRQVLTVLQRPEDAAPLAPQHGAGDVDDLVAEARVAGQPIEDTGEWGDLDAATGYVLYRCVQEALTNARRHAPGSEVLIERGRDSSSVRLEVSNPTGAGATGGDRPDGRGLTGMRERVEALGGSIEVTPGPERFHVVVVIPLGGTQ